MGEEQAVSVTFPPPPPFYHDFTAAHVARLAELQQEAAAEAQSPQPHAQLGGVAVPSAAPGKKKPAPAPPRLAGLPPPLRRLQPPPEPADGTWRVFGALYRLVDELPSLDDAEGVTRLFPPADERDRDGKGFDRATILKRLAKSLLLNFLEFVGILSLNPDDVRFCPRSTLFCRYPTDSRSPAPRRPRRSWTTSTPSLSTSTTSSTSTGRTRRASRSSA